MWSNSGKESQKKHPFFCANYPPTPQCVKINLGKAVPPLGKCPKKGCLFLRFLSFNYITYIFLFLSVSLPMDDAVLITAIDDISLHFFLSARLQNTHQPASASCLIMKRK